MTEDPQAAIERFVRNCREPALLEPGEELLKLEGDNFELQSRNGRLTLQAWDSSRNLVRRVAAVRSESPGRMELTVELFARREGKIFLVDLARRAGHDAGQRSARMVFRERFREMLARQYPGWTLAEVSSDADLRHSLSPAYARAFLRRGQHCWAAIGAPGGGDANGILTFGLIWLDYLRRRERRIGVEGLALLLPAGQERATCLRIGYLDPAAARYELYAFSPQGRTGRIDPADVGNVDTRLDPCRMHQPLPPSFEAVLAIPGVERVDKNDGCSSLRVRGVEFAESGPRGLSFGLAGKHEARERHLPEIERLARDLARMRSPAADNRDHPLYRRAPEAWLESQVRAAVETIDASLLPAPVYGQVPAFAGGERGVIDLLACGRDGRLALMELKATADPHLPLQALDYWMRVRWHLARGEFAGRGYFPGTALRPDPPRVLLVSPALEFHPATESVLQFLSPTIPFERVGLGVEWRKGLNVMFRLKGAERPSC